MQRLLSIILFVVCIISVIIISEAYKRETSKEYDSVIYPPPVTLGPNPPKCTSYGTLCHLAYNITEKAIGEIYHSHSQICQCPDGLQCPVAWSDMSNSFIRSFRSEGKEMQIKVSYCKMYQPERNCKQDEPAVILRGRGPFQFEIVQDFKCRCYRPLYAHQSWQEGPYDYFVYSCGKPRCSSNKHREAKCSTLTYVDEENFHHEYLCRCKWHEECQGNRLPTKQHPVTYKHCQSTYHSNVFQAKPRHIRPKSYRRKRHNVNKTY